MLLNAISAFKKFIESPLAFLLLFVLLIPIGLFSLFVTDWYSQLLLFFVVPGNTFFTIAYLLKTAFFEVLLFVLCVLIIMFASSLVATITLNMLLNKTRKAKKSVFSGALKVFGLMFSFYFVFFIIVLIGILLSFNVVVGSIYYLIVLILAIVLLPRWIYLPVYLVDDNEKVKDAFVDSWNKTEGKYFSIFFIMLVFAIIYQVVSWLLGNSIFLYYLTSNELIILALEVIIAAFVDAVFAFWLLAFITNK